MTPEERNRTIEFIHMSQARYEARLEQEAEHWNNNWDKLDRWTAELKGFVRRIVDLIEIESGRMDRHEKEIRDMQQEGQRQHQESMDRLDRILDRLSDPGQAS